MPDLEMTDDEDPEEGNLEDDDVDDGTEDNDAGDEEGIEE